MRYFLSLFFIVFCCLSLYIIFQINQYQTNITTYTLKKDLPIKEVIGNKEFKEDNAFYTKPFLKPIWIKIKPKEISEISKDKTILFFWFNASLDVYFTRNNQILLKKQLIDKNRLGLLYEHFTTTKKAPVNIYIHLNEQNRYALFRSLVLVDKEEYFHVIKKELSYFYDGFFVGFFLLVLFFNYLVYFSIKEKSLLYFCIFLTSILLYLSDFPYITFDYFKVNKYFVHYYDYLILPYFSLFSFCLFTAHFLETKKIKLADTLIKLYLSIILIFFIFSSIFPTNELAHFPAIFLPIFTFVGLLFIPHYKFSAILYVVSTIFIYIPFVSFAGNIFVNIQYNFFYTLQICMATASILLSYSIYQKLRNIALKKSIYEKELQEKSKLAAMGEMIGNIAHQWRQPLNIVSTTVMNIQTRTNYGKLSNETLNEKLKEIDFQLNYMSNTINDFLNFFSKNKEKELFLISEAIQSASLLTSSSIQKNSIKLKIEADESRIKTHKNELIQVLTIILNNAIDALKKQDQNRELNIKVHNLIINIDDNAKGINPEIIDKVFDPYFTTKDKQTGTGLGLYTAKMIIEKNIGGALHVVNTKEGAKFIIDLKNI